MKEKIQLSGSGVRLNLAVPFRPVPLPKPVTQRAILVGRKRVDGRLKFLNSSHDVVHAIISIGHNVSLCEALRVVNRAFVFALNSENNIPN